MHTSCITHVCIDSQDLQFETQMQIDIDSIPSLEYTCSAKDYVGELSQGDTITLWYGIKYGWCLGTVDAVHGSDVHGKIN